MPKRVLYITYVDYLDNAFPGVQAKISGHIMTLQQNGFSVDRINQYGKAAQLVDCASNETSQHESPLLGRLSINKAVSAALSQHKYDAAYIRFQFFSEDVRQICRALKKQGAKVLMEIPTYPYSGELHRQGLKGEIKLFCDWLFRRSCAKYIDAIVTLTEDEAIFGIPCIHVLNGLDYETHPIRNVRPAAEGEIHLAAVASMLPWHGYDRILRGMAEYYAKDGERVNFILHLIGQGKEIDNYRAIVEENNLHEHVIFHGMQGGEELFSIVSGCDMAVGSLAAFRIGVDRLSTLKSREYCAWGFPSINATFTDILDKDDPYCLFVPEDESPIDMERVAGFYHEIYFERGLTAEEAANEIRSAAQARSDVRAVFMPVIEFISQD